MTHVRKSLAPAVVLLFALGTGACAARNAGTASEGAPPVPRPFPGAALPPAPAPTEEPAEASEPSVTAIVSTALGFRGVPYRHGGTDPSGFDCSGFVQYVFARHGKGLPREVRDQFHVGRDIRLTEVQPGDLIFFETVSRGASHVGMAIGGDQFVHAPSSRGVVRVERFSSTYWASRFVGARRLR